ncbi:MAG: transporter [Humibacillus sp.]|nr:transporter [Humibacillus sp.]MDN5776744.1 transporter [Humibacillus sp.]
MPLYQAVSVVGSVLLLAAYAGLQTGKLNPSTSYIYQLFNLVGAACLTYSVIEPFNSGVFITEFCWTIFSIVGVVKLVRMRDANRAAAEADAPEEAARPAG